MIDQKSFSAPLLSWFADQARDLPWRRNYDPYQVWISEVMLQQTQMDRVLGYFQRWIARFPDVQALASAREDAILASWEGLGYYTRARNLHRAARYVVERLGGELPQEHASWLALPGVGPYTAAAVCAIAFNQPHAVVDANVGRVFARVFDLDTPVKERTARDFIAEHALRLTPPGQARHFSQALMELGALVCLPRRPRCSFCPLHDLCEARRLDIVLERPVPAKAVTYIPIDVATGVLMAGGLIYIQKRPTTGVWAGLWEFPGGTIEGAETPEQTLIREYMEETGFRIDNLRKLAVIRHGYTKYRVALHCFCCHLPDNTPQTPPILTAAQEFRWVSPKELDHFAFPAGHRKLIDQTFAGGGFCTE
ncbi:A/G-specific DNA-adenine glycosylase [Desulfonatronum thiosulfatophilum]|uniref:Adenine DNA glycosylase n=1 Tax=Desulfonatronum thiosulfatophilum TaxID=617002 RepID=A0A1G6C196_9BACT|nr:A/G-specific DNA-adenine glycosylase [Desulfonatronum thiosulfatophilum]